jgi:hypothetical protein
MGIRKRTLHSDKQEGKTVSERVDMKECTLASQWASKKVSEQARQWFNEQECEWASESGRGRD